MKKLAWQRSYRPSTGPSTPLSRVRPGFIGAISTYPRAAFRAEHFFNRRGAFLKATHKQAIIFCLKITDFILWLFPTIKTG
jgi:hypothetical protein